MSYLYRDVDALACGDKSSRGAVNRVEKRLQKSKSLEIVFDDASRKEYLTGFRKRKQQRREQAVKNLASKEKQQRNQDRLQRKQELKKHLGLPDNYGVANSSDDEEAEDVLNTSKANVSTYVKSGVRTIVRTVALDSEGEEIPEEEDGAEQHEDDDAQDDDKPTIEHAGKKPASIKAALKRKHTAQQAKQTGKSKLKVRKKKMK